jgi:hypothetical protein
VKIEFLSLWSRDCDIHVLSCPGWTSMEVCGLPQKCKGSQKSHPTFLKGFSRGLYLPQSPVLCVLLSFIWSPHSHPITKLVYLWFTLPWLFNPPHLAPWPHPVFQCFPLKPLVSALLPTTTFTNLIYYSSPKGSALLFQAAVPSSSPTQNTIPLLCPFLSEAHSWHAFIKRLVW